MIVAVFNYHSSITPIIVKNDNILCINYTIKTETVREQVQNMLKRLLFSSRQAFLLSKTAFKAAWDPGVPTTEIRGRERCRPGSVRDLYGSAWMFICYVGGTFMPCFCIFFADGYFCPCKHKRHIINHINKQSCKKHDRCMMVGLQNFHERREVVPDSNFWCGCPEEYTISKHFR